MIDLTHTPIRKAEFCCVFGLSESSYLYFLDQEIITQSYRDHSDPLARVRQHNAWDLIMFAFVLTMGWPIRPRHVVIDEVEEIYDILNFEIESFAPFL